MSGASVTMAADSTQADLHEDSDTKKRKKHKTHKKSKKHKRESNDGSSSDSDLDLDKAMYPISHYVKDREILVHQLFKSITAVKLRAMLPEILKPYSLEELRNLCLEQLEVMSKKRILRILDGEDPDNISSSSTEDDSEEEKERPEDNIENAEAKDGTESKTGENTPTGSASLSEKDGDSSRTSWELEEEIEEEELETEEENEEVDMEGKEVEEEEEEEYEEIEVEEEVEETEAEEENELESEVERKKDQEEQDGEEYEEVEVETETELVMTEEEEEEDAKEKEEKGKVGEKKTIKVSDTRRVEIVRRLEAGSQSKLRASQSSGPSSPDNAEILSLLPEQAEVDDLCASASSVLPVRTINIVRTIQRTPPREKSQNAEIKPPVAQTAKRPKLKRDLITVKPEDVKPESQPSTSKLLSKPKKEVVKPTAFVGKFQQAVKPTVPERPTQPSKVVPNKKTVPKTAKPSTSKPKPSLESVDDDVKHIIASSSAVSSESGMFLSKNQMEILELEMRARAIKAMLKMHAKEEAD